MPRVKGGKTTHKKHKKFLKLAEGYWGSKNRLYKKASEQVEKGWQRAYKGRKLKKRDFRSLWIVRINAACRENAVSYSKFMSGLKKASIDLNRKQLAELAATDAAAFSKLVESAKAAVK
jgi:large subunit ribosomal protein L20